MLVEEVCLQLFLEGSDGLSRSGGGWQLIPPEKNRLSEVSGKPLRACTRLMLKTEKFFLCVSERFSIQTTTFDNNNHLN